MKENSEDGCSNDASEMEQEMKDYSDEELEEVIEKTVERLNDQDFEHEMKHKTIRKLWEKHSIDPDGICLSHTWECPICDEVYYELESNPAILEELDSCRICGWEECLCFNDWGERCHPEYVESRVVDFGDNGYQICHHCDTSFHDRPDGTVHLVDPEFEIEFKGKYRGDYLYDLGAITGEKLPFDDLPERDQEMIEEVVKGTYYKSTDAWRGHHKTKTEGNFAVKIHDDCILSMSQDEKNLKKFDEGIQEILNMKEIPYIRLFTTTSNLFSSGYDLFVYSKTEEPLEDYVERLKTYYRNPSEFRRTAFSGESPESAKNKPEVDEVISEIVGDSDE